MYIYIYQCIYTLTYPFWLYILVFRTQRQSPASLPGTEIWVPVIQPAPLGIPSQCGPSLPQPYPLFSFSFTLFVFIYSVLQDPKAFARVFAGRVNP